MVAQPPNGTGTAAAGGVPRRVHPPPAEPVRTPGPDRRASSRRDRPGVRPSGSSADRARRRAHRRPDPPGRPVRGGRGRRRGSRTTARNRASTTGGSGCPIPRPPTCRRRPRFSRARRSACPLRSRGRRSRTGHVRRRRDDRRARAGPAGGGAGERAVAVGHAGHDDDEFQGRGAFHRVGEQGADVARPQVLILHVDQRASALERLAVARTTLRSPWGANG